MSFRSLDMVLVMAAFATLIATCAAAGAVARSRRRPRRFCPGPRGGGGRLARALRWTWRTGCGYDLSGAGTGERVEGVRIRCPECGRDVKAESELLRSPWRVRVLPLAALLWAGVAGMGLCGDRVVREFLRAAPSSALMVLERTLASRTPLAFQYELRRRFDREMLTPLQELDAVPFLVRDLADDDVPGNGEAARDRLLRLGPWARDELRSALRSGDAQQRRAATEILVDGGAHPTGDLLEAVIDGLACDGGEARSRGGRARRWIRDIRFVAQHVDRCQARIDEALRSEDEWRRFTAALLASFMPGRFEPERVLPSLVARLAGNDVADDATWAVESLVRWGGEAREVLHPAIDSHDRQQRLMAAVILLRIGVDADSRVAAAAVELLRGDAFPRQEFGEAALGVYEGAAAWLLRRATAAHEAIRAGAGSDDPRQRAVCRTILRRSAWRVMMAKLVTRLKDEPGHRAEAATMARAGD